MLIKRSLKKSVIVLILALFLMQTAACGFFLYPERRGRKSGKVDPAVAVMDGACLLLFLVPGIIAFAVDFSSGAIYLPANKSSLDAGNETIVMADPKGLGNESLERIVHERTGLDIDIDRANVKPLGHESPDNVIKTLRDLRTSAYKG